MSIYDVIQDKRYLIADLADIGLPEVPVVGVYIQIIAADRLDIHQHKGIFEAVYMVRGQQFFTIGDKDYRLKGNDVFITAPDVLHGSGSHIMEKAFFYWLQLRMPSEGQSILCLDAQSSAALCTALCNIKINRFVGTKKIAENFEEIFKLYYSDAPLRTIAISNLLVDILLNLLNCANLQRKSLISHDIQAAISLIENNPTQFLTVEEMAETSGLSVSRFKCKFKRQTGLPPGEYQLRGKIDFADNLLKTTNKTITQIAYDCGFSSSQYFATVYKRFTHSTPNNNRARNS